MYDNTGKPFARDLDRLLREELIAQFGGLTAYTQAPARGLWEESGHNIVKDDIVVYEVMTEYLDRQWWADYRRKLEARFAQEELIIRALAIDKI